MYLPRAETRLLKFEGALVSTSPDLRIVVFLEGFRAKARIHPLWRILLSSCFDPKRRVESTAKRSIRHGESTHPCTIRQNIKIEKAWADSMCEREQWEMSKAARKWRARHDHKEQQRKRKEIKPEGYNRFLPSTSCVSHGKGTPPRLDRSPLGEVSWKACDVQEIIRHEVVNKKF